MQCTFPLSPWDLGFDPYWDAVYDPLWDALQETGIPISQHVAMNSYLARAAGRPHADSRGHAVAPATIFMAESLASWIVAGMLERFPGLQVVLVEAGLGWLPYFLERLDRVQRSPRVATVRGQGDQGEAELLLAPPGAGDLRGGRSRRRATATGSASRT